MGGGEPQEGVGQQTSGRRRTTGGYRAASYEKGCRELQEDGAVGGELQEDGRELLAHGFLCRAISDCINNYSLKFP